MADEHHSTGQPRGDGGRWVGSDSFDGHLSRLKSLIGRTVPGAALAQTVSDNLTKTPTYRAEMLPYAEYSDGSSGLSYPQVIPDTANAMAKLGNAARVAFTGEDASPSEVMPTSQDVNLLSGLAMTGSGFGGIGKAVSGRAVEDAATSNSLASHSVEAGRVRALPPNIAGHGPLSARVYRGTDSRHGGDLVATRGDTFWASDNPAVANAYSEADAALSYPPDINMRPRIIPGDVTFQNPFVMDAMGRSAGHAGGRGLSTVELAGLAREAGHDGLVIRNVMDDDPLGTTYAALSRGTVKSPYTGETLFSNAPEASPIGWLASLFGKGNPGEAPTLAEASRPLASHSAEAGSGLSSKPMTARVYRGSKYPEDWPPQEAHNDTFWASSDPHVANQYADYGNMGDYYKFTPQVMPADVHFQNPLVVDVGGRSWNDIPWPENGPDGRTTAHLLKPLARNRGHDGLVLRNVVDPAKKGFESDTVQAATYAALRPGTVKSPLTGETLFSNAPEASPIGWLASLFGKNNSGRAVEDAATSNSLASHSVEAGSMAARRNEIAQAIASSPNVAANFGWHEQLRLADQQLSDAVKSRYQNAPPNLTMRQSASDPDHFEAFVGGQKAGHLTLARYGQDVFAADRETAPELQRRGIANALQDYAEHIVGRRLDAPSALTDEGKAFELSRNADNARRRVGEIALGDMARTKSNKTIFSNAPDSAPLGLLAAEGGEGNAIRAYRGVMTDKPDLSGERPMMFASANPDVAATYANQGSHPFENGSMMPVDMRFSNPLTVDAGGRPFWGVPFGGQTISTENISKIAKDAGHDGLIVKNVRDAMDEAPNRNPADTYVALKRGTVKSPLTGETLFANKSAPLGLLDMGHALAQQDEPAPQNAMLPRQGQPGTQSGPTDPQGFLEFLKSLGIDPSKAYGVRP